jgi:hypothetical protein
MCSSRYARQMRAYVPVLLLCACSPEAKEPSPKDGLAYLGVGPGTSVFDAGGGRTETHTRTVSAENLDDGDTVDSVATANGFVQQARSLTFGATSTESFILRRADCIATCEVFDTPVAFVAWPLVAAAENESTVNVTTRTNGIDGESHEEVHTVRVGEQANFTTPSGSFEAFAVTWTVKTTEATTTTLLHIAPDDGIVGWQADGVELRLND